MLATSDLTAADRGEILRLNDPHGQSAAPPLSASDVRIIEATGDYDEFDGLVAHVVIED